MGDKIAKCALFPKHQWGWAKNIWEHHIGPRSASATQRGVYRCDCGEVKIAAPRFDQTPALQPPHDDGEGNG